MVLGKESDQVFGRNGSIRNGGGGNGIVNTRATEEKETEIIVDFEFKSRSLFVKNTPLNAGIGQAGHCGGEGQMKNCCRSQPNLAVALFNDIQSHLKACSSFIKADFEV